MYRKQADAMAEDFIAGTPFEGVLEALNKTAIVSKTDAHGTIVFVNDKFVEISKYDREELIGQNHRILKSDEHDPEFYAELWRTISSGKLWRGEMKNRAKDGTYYWVDTSIAPIMGRDGRPERYVSVRFVITEKKEAEKELRTYRQNLENIIMERTNELSALNEALRARARELAESDRRKDEFIAVLSHELRNPLSPIMSSMELIELQGTDHPNTLDIIEVAHTHLQTMARLLDDLLDVSRITRKKFKIQKEPVLLQAVLKKAILGVTPFADNKKQRIKVHMPDNPIWIEADSLRLTQIFGNVLTNAVKYTNAAGVIEVYCMHEGTSVSVHIKDNGIGIAPHLLEAIFEMFVQGRKSSSNNTSSAGLGIGLSLTKRLVEMHSGSVSAHSEGPGKGSEFVIRLPCQHALQLSIQSPNVEIQKDSVRQLRILVVDDNESAADSLGTLLSHRGHTVTLAHGWREALKETSNGCDVALLDIGMPEMDGYDLARLIAESVSEPPALIALTGFGQDDDRRKAREAGFLYHLTKPVGLADIEEVLAKVTV